MRNPILAAFLLAVALASPLSAVDNISGFSFSTYVAGPELVAADLTGRVVGIYAPSTTFPDVSPALVCSSLIRYSPTRLAKMRLIVNLQTATTGTANAWWQTFSLNPGLGRPLYPLHTYYNRATLGGATQQPIPMEPPFNITQHFYSRQGYVFQHYQVTSYWDGPAVQVNPLVDEVPSAIMVSAPCVYVKQGGYADIMVKLTNRPGQTVTVTCSRRSGDTDLDPYYDTATFTPADWNTWKILTIHSNPANADATGQATFVITRTAGTAQLQQVFLAYDLTAPPVTLTTNIPHSDWSVPNEGFAWIPFSLSRDPGAPVVVSVSSADNGLAWADATSLAFDSSNWWQWKYLKVTSTTVGNSNGGVGESFIRTFINGTPSTTFTLHQVPADRVADDTGDGGDMISTPPPNPRAPVVTNDYTANPIISGKTVARATIVIYFGDIVFAQVVADAGGSWSWTTAGLGINGDYSLSVTSTNPHGLTSARSPACVVHVRGGTDIIPPRDPPTITVTGNATDTLVLSGVTEPDAIVRIFDGPVQVAEVTANNLGAWTWTVTGLADGPHDFRILVLDPAGNVSNYSPYITVQIGPGATPPADWDAAKSNECGTGNGIATLLAMVCLLLHGLAVTRRRR
jgi:hypothetical protein